MGEIRMFEWCGNARDPFVVVPKLFKVEKLENPTDQPVDDILRPLKSFLDPGPLDQYCLIFPGEQLLPRTFYIY